MSKRVAGPEIERLIQLLAKLPGLGPRSARRAALHLVKKRESLMQPLAAASTCLSSLNPWSRKTSFMWKFTAPIEPMLQRLPISSSQKG